MTDIFDREVPMFATLRQRDGFGSTTPELMPAVESLQRALVRAGHDVVSDGLFGSTIRISKQRALSIMSRVAVAY